MGQNSSDSQNQPNSIGFGTADTQTYYYVLNLQGDVVELVEYEHNGLMYTMTTVASYTYNAWGEVLSVTTATGVEITNSGHLGNLNPIRYRGYYYDTETGFYYLQSRYYDPVLHRFLSTDVVFDYDVGIIGYNLYLYCGNNPVGRIDTSGRDSEGDLEADIDPYDIQEYGSTTGSGYVYGGSGYWISTQTSGGSTTSGGTTSYYLTGSSSSSTTSTYGSSAGYTSYGGGYSYSYSNYSGNGVPQYAYNVYNYAQANNGAAPQGYKGGSIFWNKGNLLPQNGAPYREYDVHPYIKGINRGGERIVIGCDGVGWYTNDHYRSFTLM